MTGSEWLRQVKDEAVLREFEEMDDRTYRRTVATALIEIVERQDAINASIAEVKRPPWKGIPHAAGGFFGGIVAVLLGTKGIGGQ